MGRMMTYEAVAHFLGVHMTTVSDYANYGHLTRHTTRDAGGRKRVLFDEDQVLSFAEKYPQDAGGRRHPPMERTVSRCITEERISSGEVRYRLRMKINGRYHARTFKTLRGAEANRDRQWSSATTQNASQSTDSGMSVWTKIRARMARRPWVGEA